MTIRSPLNLSQALIKLTCSISFIALAGLQGGCHPEGHPPAEVKKSSHDLPNHEVTAKDFATSHETAKLETIQTSAEASTKPHTPIVERSTITSPISFDANVRSGGGGGARAVLTPAGRTFGSHGQTDIGNCGDGIIEGREECEDGNLINNDGCSQYCRIERCGDGVIQASLDEECDDGNTLDDNNGCDENCKFKDDCGDGIIQEESEECDDANDESGDGCSFDCQIEACGDGVIQGSAGEECDDGNEVDDGNGCSARCRANNLCGNGIVESAVEACDTSDGTCTPDCSFKIFETDFGINLNLNDDDFSDQEFSFVFPFQGVGLFQTLFVISNGNITFGEPNTDYTESVEELLFDEARIGTIWDDLDPGYDGSVHFNDLGNRVVITWLNVPEYNDSNSNTFQLQINHQGKVLFTYQNIDTDDAIVGISTGNGTSDPGAIDYSSDVLSWPLDYSTGSSATVYQEFDGDFDLENQSLYFLPQAANDGWRISFLP